MRSRRPRLTGLYQLYDAGFAAAATDPNPYEPPAAAGDSIRSHFWQMGRTDAAQEDDEIAALI